MEGRREGHLLTPRCCVVSHREAGFSLRLGGVREKNGLRARSEESVRLPVCHHVQLSHSRAVGSSVCRGLSDWKN